MLCMGDPSELSPSLLHSFPSRGLAALQEGGPAPRGRWRVLVDAAKGCASQPPDLSRHPADFVALSFYKLFGFPTGACRSGAQVVAAVEVGWYALWGAAR